MPRRKLIALALAPPALALHIYLIAIGGGWRWFAIVELCVGLFVGVAVHEAKKLDRAD